MIFVVSRKINVLSKIKGRQHWQKLRGEGVGRIVKVYVKIAGDDKFVRCSGSLVLGNGIVRPVR